MKRFLLLIPLAGLLLALPVLAHDQHKPPANAKAAGAAATFTSLRAAWTEVKNGAAALEKAIAAKDGNGAHQAEETLSGALRWLESNSASVTGDKAKRLAAALKQALQAAHATHDAADANDFAKAETERKKLAGALKVAEAQYPAGSLSQASDAASPAGSARHGDMKEGASDAHDHPASAAEPSLRSSLQLKQPLSPGVKADAVIRLSTADGKPVTLDMLSEAHTEKIHLLIIDGSLSDYHHEHPRPTATPGEYAFSFTPRQSGPYRVWADVIPTATKMQEYVIADLPGSGSAGKITDRVASLRTKAGDLEFDVTIEPKELVAGADAMGKVTIRGKDGQPFAKLEPLMGAYAHIVGFSEDYKTIAHIHPMGEEPTQPSQRGGPSLDFHMKPEQPGLMRLFVQIQVDGKNVFAPLTLQVAAAAPSAVAASTTGRQALPAELEAVVSPYITIQTALASDTMDGVSTAAAELLKAAKAQPSLFDASLVGAAQTLASAKEIKSARAALRALSDPLIKVTAERGGKNSGRVEAYCPMAKGAWIQTSGKLRNPYYGASMLECGSVKRPL